LRGVDTIEALTAAVQAFDVTPLRRRAMAEDAADVRSGVFL
jgi:hypothetical protein